MPTVAPGEECIKGMNAKQTTTRKRMPLFAICLIAHLSFQIEQFRGARNSYRREPIGANYRTTQNLRGRIVEASFDSHKDSSSSLRLSSILLAVCFLSWATFNLKN